MKKEYKILLAIGGIILCGVLGPAFLPVKDSIVNVLIFFGTLYSVLAFIAYFISVVKKWPRMQVWKSVCAIFFIGGCFPPVYNWPLYIVSVIAAMVYLNDIGQTNGTKGAVIFFLVMSSLGIPYCWWALLEPGSLISISDYWN